MPEPTRRHVQPATRGTALRIGFTMGTSRFLGRSSVVSAVLGAAWVMTLAAIERHVTTVGAVDRVLTGTFRVVVPLLSFTITANVLGRNNLRDAVWTAARYGVARRHVALGMLGAALCASAAAVAGLAVLAVMAAHGDGNPPMAVDALTSAWIGILVAAAYAGWFALGMTFGRHGGGRWAVLLSDVVLGSSTGIAGVWLPRAHAMNLLGHAPPLGLSQPSSSAILAVSALLLGGLAALRCRS